LGAARTLPDSVLARAQPEGKEFQMKPKILAVDDQEHIVRLVQITLERVGYSVRTAPDGLQALQMVQAEPPDLIICDVMMPRMNGFEVVRRLRAEEGTKDIPIIMLTVRTGDTDVSDAWGVGVDCYLSKPFDPSELVTFVQRLLPAPGKKSE